MKNNCGKLFKSLMELKIFSLSSIICKVKVKLSLYRPWRPLGLREVKAPTFSDIRHIDGGKVVSPTRRFDNMHEIKWLWLNRVS
jgi:hypothetical protein